MRHAGHISDDASLEAPHPQLRATARVGTSGWIYPPWRGHFYPRDLPHARELAYLAEHLPAVEVNGTFYSLTRPGVCDAWRRAVGPDFVFAVKGSRYITHMLKLRDVAAPLANFFASGILRLGSQLGPILWQLPAMVRFGGERCARFLAALPEDVRAAERLARRHDARVTGRACLTAPDGRERRLRHALEVRHESFLTDAALDLLARHGVALVVADTAGRHPFAIHDTADFRYVRLHGATELYRSRYTGPEIARWARRVRRWLGAGQDTYVFFDNTDKRHAPGDAVRLLAALAARERCAA